ncbi:Ig-like domain-containing protein [Silvimonas sp.]|uniref:beta strand repeat-containing protein n=1 Tax=Silvimonas sp. TaxID=2650811 RepID=UPI002849E499|nr:Ig-like domain-containing protein [Silvimonas sp.]MDR3426923.1 Ig-like domain-containing protein [Silvimonas sp.]
MMGWVICVFRSLRLQCCALFLSSILATLAYGQVTQVTTYHYDNGRTGTNQNETILNTSNVNAQSFGKLYSLPVDGQVYAQPLYMANVSVPQQGTHNVVYIVTEHNSVFAFDADTGGSPLWQVNLGPPMPASVCCVLRDLYPEIGITATPVIDPASQTIYVVAETYDSGVAHFRLHALDLATGADKLTPTLIQGTALGSAPSSVNGVITFSAMQHWQRPGLLLMNGNIYIAFGSHQDTEPYQGWIFAYSASTLQRTSVLCISPNAGETGIWQGGVGLTGDANGNIYVETGNGDFTASTGGIDYGDSILKIATNNGSGMAIVDYFTPSTQAADALNDWDLGSSGILLIPGTSLGIAGAKDGKFYVFNTNNLGQYNPAGDQITQEWQATFAYSDQAAGGFWGGNYIFYNSTIYGFGERDILKMFAFNGSSFITTPMSQGTFIVPAGISNDPGMSISANGLAGGSAVLWAAFSSTGVANGSQQTGVFYAFDAADASKVLWTSNQNRGRDFSGSFAKWVPPIVVNGKVYLPSFSNYVSVYGLLPSGIGGGSITGSGTSATTTANLTTEGTADWVHWGDAAVTRKAGVSAQISNYSVIGTGTPKAYANDVRGLSWTDGTPTATGNNKNGLFLNNAGNGYSFTAPAGLTPRTLTVHVGGYNTSGSLVAHLSDGSAPDFVDTTPQVAGQYDRNYTLTYTAASEGQTLTVYWEALGGSGNVALSGAALSAQSAGTIAATAGTPQSTTVSTAFATPLQATVKDGQNNPVSGVTVTFTAPASGASATFNGAATATATTNASGVATAPALTANAQSGSYVIAASAPGANVVASFNLTNNAVVGVTTNIAATAGTPQSANTGAAFNTALQVTVTGNGGTPVSGVVVTFTAPASGASATFSGSATATATTNTSGIATAPQLTANSTAGTFAVSATTPGATTPASFALTNTTAGGGGNTGAAITGSGTSAATTVSLSAEGLTDWVHWGDAAINRKAGVTTQISNYTVTSTGGTANVGQVLSYNNDPRTLTWSGGTPTATASNKNGIYIAGTGNGFSFTAPAGTTTRVLIVHVGGWKSSGTLTAHLSDGSAADFVDTTTLATGQYDRNYTLTYTAASSAQTLTVTWAMASGTGNVTLNGAALVQQAGITTTAGTPQSAAVNASFATALQVLVKDNTNTPVSGASVTFAAPATGASAAFGGAATATVTTDANGLATAPTLTANGQIGSYTVTASAAGISNPGRFSLTNTASTGALTGSGTSSATTTSLTSEGTADWVHWGDSTTTVNRKAGVTAQLGNYVVVGTGKVQTYVDDPRTLSWSDGAPTATGSNKNGIYIANTGNGFSVTAPAGLATRTLTIHVGGWKSSGTLTAHLSDSSAADFVDTTTLATGQYDRNYTLTYAAGSSSATLTVSWVMQSGTGNVTFNAATLQ